ncbi:MAG: type 1 glutamine amidotransferase [Deltaproteobacteria bacterium]|nr:type 1 glutamine amidotransferase [Deltaproteobacteria bacterium]
MNRILILDNSIDHGVYQPLEHWKPLLLFPFDSFRVSAGEMPGSLDPYSHVIVTGSEASVLGDLDWILAEEELLRLAVGMGKVILGSCFGHQMIARSLFGKETVRRMKEPEIGWSRIRIIRGDSLVGRAGQYVHTFLLHFDEVCGLPKQEATVLARSARCRVQAFKLRQRPVWGIQAHPEIGIVEGLRLLGSLLENDEHRRRYLARAERSCPRDSGWIVPLMRAFQQSQSSAKVSESDPPVEG